MDATVDTSSQVTGPHAAHNAGVLATLPAADPDTLTCAVCEKEKAKTVFARREDWPAHDEPLCRKCRDARTLDATPQALVKLSTPELIGLHDDVLARTLQAISAAKLKQANAKDLAIVAKNILLNKQLLEEKPTQIVSSGDRETVRKLLEAIRAEKARKAKVIDVTAAEVPA